MDQTKGETNWSQERQKLIQKIVESKAQHQQSILHFKEKSSDCNALISEKLDMEKQHSKDMNSISNQLNALQTETVELKARCSRSESENVLLSRENQLLKARLKQFETSQQTSGANDAAEINSKNEPDEYEIQQIVDHKKQKNGFHFQVRWKNYEAKDDTWEHESSLMCTLCKYKRKMNLK